MRSQDIHTLTLICLFIIGAVVMPVDSDNPWTWVAILVGTKAVAFIALMKLLKHLRRIELEEDEKKKSSIR